MTISLLSCFNIFLFLFRNVSTNDLTTTWVLQDGFESEFENIAKPESLNTGLKTSLRVKRYAIEGSYWGVREITWRVSRSSRKMSEMDVRKVLKRAFKVWEEHTQLKFIHKPMGNVHIEIMFAEGNHGDGEPFDGLGKILAHAYFPRYGGDVHLDDAEQWSPDKYGDGIDLYAVAVHEIGHSLGLKHSHERNAIMAPFYQTYTGHALHLHQDDLNAVDRLYGVAGAASKMQPPPQRQRLPDICKHSSLDAITRVGNGSMYAFQGEFYWRVLEGKVAEGYPRRIDRDWPFEGSIDATLTDREGDTYIFKGIKYWLIGINGEPRKGYPRLISDGLSDTPNDLDAALVWHVDDRPYFFKNNKYWKYSRWGMPKGWPRSTKSLSMLHGLDHIDAALRYTDHSSYLFVGEKYYKVIGRRMLRIAPGYPRSTAQMWFGCDGQEHLLK